MFKIPHRFKWMQSGMPIETFSQRLLNPFRGVMNIIRYNTAEAITTDGIHWDIFVRNDEQARPVRYGRWSIDEGLIRGPLSPSCDFVKLERMGEFLCHALSERHEQVPFELRDHYELWIIDSNDNPLALIHSVCEEKELVLDMATQWRAGDHCQKTFVPELNDVVIGENMTAAEMLMLHIHMLAGYPVRARWYRRDETANGTHIASVNSDEVTGETLPASAFSPFFINEQPDQQAFNKLLQTYTDWQAPWLLLLPHLTHEQRSYLEQQACKQALLVDALYRLYPQIIHEKELRGVRVEAMMRKNQPMKKDEETILSRWYLELGKDRHGKSI